MLYIYTYIYIFIFIFICIHSSLWSSVYILNLIRWAIYLTNLSQSGCIVTWWRHQMEKFTRYWPFVRVIHRSPVNSPHKGQWRGAFVFSLICARINSWVNNGEAGDLRRHRGHYDVIVMNLQGRSHGNHSTFITITEPPRNKVSRNLYLIKSHGISFDQD